jgi:ABC-type antimicrobial peptide transport system permease subunit
VVFKNLFRRKARTLLTALAISIGVAAIVALGAVAQGMKAGLTSMTRGSEADLVLTQGGALSALMSSIDAEVADEVLTWPEVADVDGVLLGNSMRDGRTQVFVFGHDPHGFSVEHFCVIEGVSLAEARSTRGKPLLLGKRAAEGMELDIGDTLRLSGSVFRVVGIYETGDSFEDGAVLVPLSEAQTLMLLPRRVSMIYIKLDPRARDTAAGASTSMADRLRARLERRYSELSVSATSGLVEQEEMLAVLEAMAMGVAGLAVVIGGLGMTNTLFMSVMERTREIGLLRALGWRRRQVIVMILGESLVLALLGGLLGAGLGIVAVLALGSSSAWIGLFGAHFSAGLFIRALVTVTVLGAVGGAYPAWWASRLLPVEALRYEGGAGAKGRPRSRATRKRGRAWARARSRSVVRAYARACAPPIGVRNLWRQRTRTALTTLGIGVSIAAIVALGALATGMTDMMNDMWRASQTDLFAIQADVDADFSAIDERDGARIAARSDVEGVAGMVWTAVNTDAMSFLMLFGYHPREYAIRHFRIIEGQPLTARHQVIVGKQAAEQMGLQVGDTMRLLKSSFRVVGIYETGLAYEELGAVIGLREAQSLTGKLRQVMYYQIKLRDPKSAGAVREDLAADFPGIDFALAAEATQSMSDFAVMEEMFSQISILAVLVGGLGMLNTMLMSVLERTREVGLLRSLGWRRRQVLGMILRESLILGILGGLVGILLGLGLGRLMGFLPGLYGGMSMVYEPALFAQALAVALLAGAVGGLYPAWRATRLRPVEALRYE